MVRIKRVIARFIINNFLSCTRFFKVKRALLNFAGLNIGKKTKVVGPIDFGNNIKVTIGDNCWIGKNLSLDGDGQVIIGNNVDIAPHVIFNTGGHIIGEMERRAGRGVVNKIRVGNGTWIGTKVVIINNTNIYDGCVVAAGTVINKSIEKDNVLIAGVPGNIKKNLN